MTDDLVERVAREIYYHYPDCKRGAAAATALALEEAAMMCERRFMGDHTREDMEARRCAAAIRAMIPKEPV